MARSAPGRCRPLPARGRGPALVGVINATPDSFWRGSRLEDPGAAAAAARSMRAAGAAAIDVGAVSTRPGAPCVSQAEELERLLPVLAAVRAAVDCPVSVDTARAAVAERALAAGADAINDVSGLVDPDLAGAVASAGASLILTACSALGGQAGAAAAAGAVAAELAGLQGRARAAGVPADRLVCDPGFGFGKTPEQNLALVAGLPLLRERLDAPICIGPSRKGTIAHALGGRAPEERLWGTAALVALGAAYGADLIRVHDVAEMSDVARVAAAVGPPRAPAPPGRISLRGLRVDGRHGVLPDEHHRPQPFVLDVDLDLDLRRAADADDLGATVDYAEVAELAAEVVRGPHRALIERLAAEIAARLLQRYPALVAGAVTVHKPQAPIGLPFADVAVRWPFCRNGAGSA